MKPNNYELDLLTILCSVLDVLWDLQFQQASTEAAILELDKRVMVNSKAKSSARRSASMQPILFRAQGHYFVKVDHTAVPVSDASCFSEAVEFLFMSFLYFGWNTSSNCVFSNHFWSKLLG